MKKSINIRKILTVSIALLIIVYVFSNFYLSNIGKVETDTISYAKVYDSYNTQGYIVKSESVINEENTDNVYYVVQDGESISPGETVAYQFENSEDVETKQKIDKLQSEIDALNELNSKSDSDTYDLENIDSQIKSCLVDYNNVKVNGKYLKLGEYSDEVLGLLNSKLMYSGKISSFSEKISELSTELAALQATLGKSSSHSVASASAGYFSSVVDGYENKVDYNNIANIKVSDIEGVQPDTDKSYVGKVIDRIDWYVVSEIPIDKAYTLSQYDDISIGFSSISTDVLPAKVLYINKNADGEKATLILKCNYMSEEFVDLRKETVNINFNSYEGLSVPKSAVHMINTDNGEGQNIVYAVYVLNGTQLELRQIQPIYSYSDYIICDDSGYIEDAYTEEVAKLNDKIVIRGDNLYDGKVVM